MNFISTRQLSVLILLEICGVTIEAKPANCNIKPNNVDKLDVLVYINGDTSMDRLWYGPYCSWKAAGMPYDKYAPVTVKVGGDVVCDKNNKCNCMNNDSSLVDCTVTFQHVCAEQILGQAEFKNLLCCSIRLINENGNTTKGLQTCIKERPGLAEKIATCMKKTGPGSPQDIAVRNSKEVVKKVVDLNSNTEPFFFYNGLFDKCISDDSIGWFLQKICLMLKFDIAKTIKQCRKAMGWKP